MPLSNITRRQCLERGLSCLLLAGAVEGLSGCGTLLHPERRGQRRTGKIDWGVVALDGVGLLFFFIPGVIAFAVDFSYGTLFLPPTEIDEYEHQQRHRHPELSPYPLGTNSPTQAEVEKAVSSRIGQPIHLDPGTYHYLPMESLDQFWDSRLACEAEAAGSFTSDTRAA